MGKLHDFEFSHGQREDMEKFQSILDKHDFKDITESFDTYRRLKSVCKPLLYFSIIS